MSLIWADGFENSSLWSRAYSLADTAPTLGTGRSGNCLSLTGATSTPSIVLYNIPSADQHATIILGCAFNAVNSFQNSNSSPFLRFLGDTGTTTHVNLYFDSTSSGANITAARDTTVLGTSSGLTFNTNQWYYLEVKVVLHDTTGSVVVKQNGTTILNLTNVDTKNAGTGSVIDAVRFRGRVTNTTTVLVDDLYLLNGAGSVYNDFLGDITVETIRPNGNGNVSEWDGSDGNSTDNYLLIDEATYDQSDYVRSGTTNEKDLYAYGSLAAATGTVKGVVAKAVMSKTASGAQSARQISRISSTNYNGGSETLTTTDSVKKQAWEQSPATSSDWTISEVNGAEFGVEVL